MPLRPLAVAGFAVVALVAPIATVFAFTGGWVAAMVAAGGWAAVAAYWVRAARVWPDVEPTRGRAALVGGMVLAWIALVAGFFANYWISVARDLCGDGSTEWIALAAAVGVYVAAAALLIRNASRLLWLWPLLVVGMWGVSLLLRAVLPGGHGFCET